MRLWIRDEDHTPQRFPLQKLLREVIRAAGAQSVVIHVRRVDGQGERVKQLADKLDTMETVAIPLSELDALAKGTD
jgi:thiazole synthase ThiGH ThiG subunit